MSAASIPTRPFSRPAFPHLQHSTSSSQSSTTYQSYSGTSSLATPMSASSAPLPSPSASQPPRQGFFGSLNQQPTQQVQPPSQTQSSSNYQPARGGAGQTAAETNSFLSQTGLLAEAAKRAQMAVVMRDIEGMEL
ncbi:hypothetical protein BDV95DRAFT_610531 [Massariosphaeria phaeospora]|uniref:Uncharacterized protein n=1 Tax=Massariosphaeria phaeospora TaxID=100035 RepID=A0A7C8M3T5_9PLEO|nr:hypothetical protein BDV95DRAFT_610531 [Massariosphaeria phaeospora]